MLHPRYNTFILYLGRIIMADDDLKEKMKADAQSGEIALKNTIADELTAQYNKPAINTPSFNAENTISLLKPESRIILGPWKLKTFVAQVLLENADNSEARKKQIDEYLSSPKNSNNISKEALKKEIRRTLPASEPDEFDPFGTGLAYYSSANGKITIKQYTKEDIAKNVLSQIKLYRELKENNLPNLDNCFDSLPCWVKEIVTQPDFESNFNKYEKQIIDRIYQETMQRNTQSDQFRTGSQYAQLTTFIHEFNHLKNSQYDAAGSLNMTPVNNIRHNSLTEEISFAAEYLNRAYMYTNHKNQGITQIHINNQGLKNIEELITPYPGLKEAVTNGFDYSKSEDVRRVVQAASEEWNRNRANAYISQFQTNLRSTEEYRYSQFTLNELAQAVQNEDKDFKKVAARMMKNVTIFPGIAVNLNHCADLLNNMPPSKAENFLAEMEKDNIACGKDIIQLNDWLNANNVPDDDKMAYLQYHCTRIGARVTNLTTEEQKLKHFFLSTYGKITYADGITETINRDGHRIITDKNKNTCDLGIFEDQTKKTTQQANLLISQQQNSR